MEKASSSHIKRPVQEYKQAQGYTWSASFNLVTSRTIPDLVAYSNCSTAGLCGHHCILLEAAINKPRQKQSETDPDSPLHALHTIPRSPSLRMYYGSSHALLKKPVRP
ncbi:uncharacterized protein YALI1_F10288g [Yarrowia lipolytica]|uniref:Uncharacterized protein n=1 Tax=Yarrowia lipolytica TaxID=4952 RepID=A0A1D8NMD7_YARLL|nr:hypothetical protein YALI1_F10288g [Yarrowia lipolytica]